MRQKGLKYIFFIVSAFILVTLMWTSRDAGISCDEVLHYKQSVSVYDYFASHGADRSALNTPVTHLKYYGQAYDNFVTILIRWLGIDDVYQFRHIMSSLAGWLTMLVTALFAVWLADWRAGIIVLLLYAVSPTFIGHSQNNLKDIPFALGYITATFFTMKFVFSGRKKRPPDIIFLTLGIAFALSIRAGGIILICYLLFFWGLYYGFIYLRDRNIDLREIARGFGWMTVIIVVAWLLSILLWPFAQQGPVRNVIESYRVMAHFPDTFRQIFEGKEEWSDFMPWYYLPKSMAITIPVIILSGLILFCFNFNKIHKEGKTFQYLLIIFTILFPMSFVIYERSNLYSSWRQFLFLYPAVVLLSGIGYHYLFKGVTNRVFKWVIVGIMVLLSFPPLRFIIANHPYEYLYYNILEGGIDGAYTNYEMDYYFTAQTEASQWLIDYLKERDDTSGIKVKATYSVVWQFRNQPAIKTSYFRYDERSQYDWDYAIVTNRYISPFKLRHHYFPPANAIRVIYVDTVPVCAVLKRKTKEDYYGYIALNEGKNKEAISHFEKALKNDDTDEMIFFNFAAALCNDGQCQKADSVLKKALEINPDFELGLMYLGNIARSHSRDDDAIMYYERLIKADRKYFEAYVSLSRLLMDDDLMKARALLKTCLDINPGYKPAIMALADTYRETNPDIASKYDELARTLK